MAPVARRARTADAEGEWLGDSRANSLGTLQQQPKALPAEPVPPRQTTPSIADSCLQLSMCLEHFVDAQRYALEEFQADHTRRLSALSVLGGLRHNSVLQPTGGAKQAMHPPSQPEPPSPPEEEFAIASEQVFPKTLGKPRDLVVVSPKRDAHTESKDSREYTNGHLLPRMARRASGESDLSGYPDSCESADESEKGACHMMGSMEPQVGGCNMADKAPDSWIDDNQRQLFLSIQKSRQEQAGNLVYMISDFLGCQKQLRSCVERLMRRPEDRPDCGKKAGRIVGRYSFNAAVTALIIVNAFWIALTTQDYMRRCLEYWSRRAAAEQDTHILADPAPKWMLVVDTVFACAFTVELILRLASQEATFFLGDEYRWNVLDMVVALSCWVDLALEFTETDREANVSFLRVFRLLRLLRSLRVVRILRFLREMRLIMLSLLSSLWPLLWALLALSLVMFSFVMVFMQGVAEFILSADGKEHTIVEELSSWFDSFPTAFLTLFKVITGGTNWDLVHEPLQQASFAYGNLFVLYIAIMVFGVLNVITGIFVECAVTKARADNDLSLQEEMERERSMMKQLIQFFKTLDSNMSGTVSLSEWESFIRMPNAKAVLTLLGLDIAKTRQIFELIDTDGSNEVELEEFVIGCMKLQGGTKTIDLEAMLQNNKRLVRKNLKHMEKLERHIKKILDAKIAALDERLDRTEVNERRALEARASLLSSTN